MPRLFTATEQARIREIEQRISESTSRLQKAQLVTQLEKVKKEAATRRKKAAQEKTALHLEDFPDEQSFLDAVKKQAALSDLESAPSLRKVKAAESALKQVGQREKVVHRRLEGTTSEPSAAKKVSALSAFELLNDYHKARFLHDDERADFLFAEINRREIPRIRYVGPADRVMNLRTGEILKTFDYSKPHLSV